MLRAVFLPYHFTKYYIIKHPTHYQTNLPHIQPPGATYFVTFRLQGSLTPKTIEHLRLRYDNNCRKIRDAGSQDVKKLIYAEQKRAFGRYDNHLDNNILGKFELAKPEAAEIMANKMLQYDGSLYDLLAFTIMPNHVHLLIDTSVQLIDENNLFLTEVPENYVPLFQIMKLIKGGGAFEVNRLNGTKGNLFQKDNYDHLIRHSTEQKNIFWYILNNPVKAGLTDSWRKWNFTYAKKELLFEYAIS